MAAARSDGLGPISPELILVSPQEIARLARELLPDPPWAVSTPAPVETRLAPPPCLRPIIVAAEEPAPRRRGRRRVAFTAALAAAIVVGFVLATMRRDGARPAETTGQPVATTQAAKPVTRKASAHHVRHMQVRVTRHARVKSHPGRTVHPTAAKPPLAKHKPKTVTVEPTMSTLPTTPTPTTSTPTVSTTQIEISEVHPTSLSPFAATIAWRTSEPVTSQVAYGLDSRSLWTAAGAPSVDHSAVVNGLTFNTTYRLWVDAHASDGRTASSPFLLTTPPLSGPTNGGTGNSAFLVDGQPLFPTMVWNACVESYATAFAAGIDLFMGQGCGGAERQLGALGGRGFLVSDALDAAAPGAVGTFLPDEWDTHLPSNLTTETARHLVPDNGGGPRFLTLTNHFYSVAAPLPQGRGMYSALVQTADVVGFDLYPLQNWCRYDDFGHVFESQRQLVQLAAGKPTFQWIEARGMDCHDPTLTPTAETVHAETWLAIAGGAHAIGYFPYDFGPGIGAQIAMDKRQIQSLVPALLEPPLQASAANPVKVGAREHNGAIYVIAVNASRVPVSAAITVPSLGSRRLTSLDGGRSVTSAAGAFSDTFAPLEVHVYIAAPTS